MTTMPRSPKNKTVAILLALFLGGLGAHKFYLERPGIAMMYLLLCWTFVPTVVSLIEAIYYLSMSSRSWMSYSSK